MSPLLSGLVDLESPLQAPFLVVSLAIQSHPHQSDLRAEMCIYGEFTFLGICG